MKITYLNPDPVIKELSKGDLVKWFNKPEYIYIVLDTDGIKSTVFSLSKLKTYYNESNGKLIKLKPGEKIILENEYRTTS